MQLLNMERSTCAVTLSIGGRIGRLKFVGGQLFDATLGNLQGDEAVFAMLQGGEPRISVERLTQTPERSMTSEVQWLLLEAARRRDESGEETGSADGGGEPRSDTESGQAPEGAGQSDITVTEEEMSRTDEILRSFSEIVGFKAVAVFSPQGETLAKLADGSIDIDTVGALANNTLINAQKASIEMGAGRADQVHVEGEQTHILVRCKNEGSDRIKPEPGKAHIHLVLVMGLDALIGMAKMRLHAAAEELAPLYR
jgi:predicted regulator of Ras-like GTPase activity (Roadblock/LC7/MglB family)